MNLLAIDTATEACSVALWCDGKVHCQRVMEPRGHSARVLPMVEAVLNEAGIARSSLDVIACDRGPGSFTGIRIGVGVAQGIAMGLDRPVVGVSSLLALAELCGKEAVLPAIDARMGQVYWALLCQDKAAPTGWTCRQPEQVSAPDSVVALALRAVGVGSGWDRYPDVLSRCSGDWIALRFPDATAIASIAVREIAAVGIEKSGSAAPVYLRDRVTD